MTIQEAQRQVDQWIQSYGVRYFDPMTNMVLLMEEVGELSRWMARTYGEQSFNKVEEPAMAKEAIQSEMADVFWILLCLANQCDIKLEKALEASIKKKTQRDHSRHRQNPKLSPE